MKICCLQEHYDKVVQYANSIQDRTLQNCLERLQQWEKNGQGCEIELYYDSAPYSFGFCERYADGKIGICGRTAVSRQPGPVVCRNPGPFPRMEHPYVNRIRIAA